MMLSNLLLNLFFPPRCPFCAQIREDAGICPSCQQSLPWIGEEILPLKGRWFERCYAPLWYRGLTVHSFHRYKFSGRRRYASCYGKLMAQSVEGRLSYTPNLVTWAPVSGARRRRRGYDQSQLLAQHVARHLGCGATSTLVKCRHTPPQSSLETEAEKRANAQGAYRLAEGVVLEGKQVLLVDDIVTTGSTLNQCAKVLREAGAVKVDCVTLARSHKMT